jgi:hypothetical protein
VDEDRPTGPGAVADMADLVVLDQIVAPADLDAVARGNVPDDEVLQGDVAAVQVQGRADDVRGLARV